MVSQSEYYALLQKAASNLLFSVQCACTHPSSEYHPWIPSLRLPL